MMENYSALHNNDSILSQEAFLFDLDGVIIDSERVYTEIWKEIDNRFPTGVSDFEYKIKGTTLDNILATYFPDREMALKVTELLYELEGAIKYEVIPGARKFLEHLKNTGKKIALVTSSNDVKMSHLWFQHPELKQYFDFIVTADMISRSKPDPEGYLLAASKVGCYPEKCVVIEDSLQGVKAGKAAHAKVIGVAGTLSAEVLEPYSDIVVSDLSIFAKES